MPSTIPAANRRQPAWAVPLTAPGPEGRDMLRQFGLIRRDPVRFLAGCWHRHGDIVQLPIPRPGVYLLSDPAAVRDVLVASARHFDKRTLQYDTLRVVTGDGLLTVDDPPWRHRRRALQPAFHAHLLDDVATQVRTACEQLARRWRRLSDPTVVDVDAAMMELSLQVVASALFGSDWGRIAPGLTRATVTALDGVVARARNPLALPPRIPTPANRRLTAAVAELNRAVDQLVCQAKVPGARPGTLVDLLVRANSDGQRVFDERAVRDELVTFLIAGHETVASALSWAWFELGRHRQLREQVRLEGHHLRNSGGIAGTAWNNPLPATRSVVDEVLRLYPPAWVITRRSRVPQDLAGAHVPAGSLVIISPWIVHRHPQVWNRPDDFDPSRFDGPASAQLPGYLPFGMGGRMCIGRDLALLEATLVLAWLSAEFDLTAVRNAAVEPLASVTLRPRHGLPMRVRRLND